MIYVCIPSYNEAPTVGLLLWKIRQVFAGFPREYQLLVLDDGSDRHDGGSARAVRPSAAPHRADPPRAAGLRGVGRGAAPEGGRPHRPSEARRGDSHARRLRPQPADIPDLVRRVDSGADLVVAEGRVEGEPSRAHRRLRHYAPLLLRGVVSVPGVKDVVSGFAIFRLVVLRNAIRSQADRCS